MLHVTSSGLPAPVTRDIHSITNDGHVMHVSGEYLALNVDVVALQTINREKLQRRPSGRHLMQKAGTVLCD